MSDHFELELTDDEFSELKRASFQLGITPEEAAMIALRDYIRKFEAEQRAQLADAIGDTRLSEFENRPHELSAEDENILHRLADEEE
ncbi:MAG: hypothetical protein ACKO61_02775 [Actinomycetota bacterium]